MNLLYPKYKNEISCVFATDNEYALYLGVAIQSLICNASSQHIYGIYILEESLDEKYKTQLKKLEKTNVHINFINTREILQQYEQNIFYTHSHFSKATYYRFFIPDIFNNFKKIIYLDCDLIINTDIKELFDINLNDKLAGCVNSSKYKSGEMIEYIKSLGLKDPYTYFNAGVIVFDIDKLKFIDFTNQCIKTLKNNKNLRLLDQDVLNIVFEQKIKFLDASWNVFNNNFFTDFQNENRTTENEKFFIYLEKCAQNPKIIHYTSNLKPWNNLNLINSHFFWKYARKTPFYIILLFKLIHHIMHKHLINIMKKSNSIFSIHNDITAHKKSKVITIFGIKIKFKKSLGRG